MRISDPRYVHDRARYDLAHRMLAYGGKSRSITRWTGLGRYQIEKLAASYRSVHMAAYRRTGRAPAQPRWFFGTVLRAQHSSILAGIYRLLEVTPQRRCANERDFSTLARGWLLCRAYQAYLDGIIVPQITFEYAALLAWELNTGETLTLRQCTGCEAALIIDHLELRSARCGYCRGRLTPKSIETRLSRAPPPRRRVMRYQRRLF